MYLIIVYIPVNHLALVKQAMFQAGGGRVGQYDCCAWQVLGEGQFRALKGSTPFIGQQDQIETVQEYRVEMVCAVDKIQQVIAAMKQAHPYETPAYHVIRLDVISQ
jgi:hypothetical protein